MARKFGKTYELSQKFEDYNYILLGVGGIGKTTTAVKVGKIITGSDEGTFVITCGMEPTPKHIAGSFGDVAPDFKTFCDIVKELCDNKADYPNTKFVAVDSMDEYSRIAEKFVVNEYNAGRNPDERVKSISQAYGGFQKGESRACELMINQVLKLQNAGYSLIFIGHTKVKTKESAITNVKYEQLTCNLDNKYYNALKDKCNLVAMCYFEDDVENVKEVTNAFSKQKEKKGDLVDRKRMMIFADDTNAVDTKSHFDIVPKVELSAENFIKAVKDALAKMAAKGCKDFKIKEPVVTTDKKVSAPVENVPTISDEELGDAPEKADEPPFDVDDDGTAKSKADRIAAIKSSYATVDTDTKKAIKKILIQYSEDGAGKLNEALPDEALDKIESLLNN